MNPPFDYDPTLRRFLRRQDEIDLLRAGNHPLVARRLAEALDDLRDSMKDRRCAVHQGHPGYEPERE
jgi:hypothetical protein